MEKIKKDAYLEVIRKRYRKANKAGKGKILDEFCAVCGYQRKYALRRLHHSSHKKVSNKPGRRSRYDVAEVMKPLKVLWLTTDQLASKRLKPAIALGLPHYEARYACLSDEARTKLHSISAATIDRLLKPVRAQAGMAYPARSPAPYSKNRFPCKDVCGTLRSPDLSKPIQWRIVAIAWQGISSGVSR